MRIDEAVASTRVATDRKLPDLDVTGAYMRLSKPNVRLRSDSSGGGGSTVKVSQAAYGMANLSLPIYAGSKIKYGIESARYLEQAARLDADHDRQRPPGGARATCVRELLGG